MEYGPKDFGLRFILAVVDPYRSQVDQDQCDTQEQDEFFAGDIECDVESAYRAAISSEFEDSKDPENSNDSNRPKVESEAQKEGKDRQQVDDSKNTEDVFSFRFGEIESDQVLA